MNVKGNKLQHERAQKKAPADTSRSVRSVLSKHLIEPVKTVALYAGVATFLTVSCIAYTADSKNPKNPKDKGAKVEEKKEVIVTPDKQGPTKVKDEAKESKKTEIQVTELNGYQLKFKEKNGNRYEDVKEHEFGFFLKIAVKKPIYIADGKKALVVTARVSNDEESLKKGGTDASNIFIRLFDVKTKTLEYGWAPDLEDLRKEYKEMTGKEFEHFHVVVEQGGEGKDEYVQFYIIPASSKKYVENGTIESEMPIEIVKIKLNPDGEKYESAGYTGFVTASLESGSKDGIVAKK